MVKAYLDGVFPDDEYRRQRKILEMELEYLVVPEAYAAEEAGGDPGPAQSMGKCQYREKKKAAAHHAGRRLC